MPVLPHTVDPTPFVKWNLVTLSDVLVKKALSKVQTHWKAVLKRRIHVIPIHVVMGQFVTPLEILLATVQVVFMETHIPIVPPLDSNFVVLVLVVPTLIATYKIVEKSANANTVLTEVLTKLVIQSLILAYHHHVDLIRTVEITMVELCALASGATKVIQSVIKVVNQTVSRMKTVQIQKLVSTINALTLVLLLAVLMLSADPKIIAQSATVLMVWREIHTYVVFPENRNLKRKIPVIQHHVEPMLTARYTEVAQSVHVFKAIMVILLLAVNPNVSPV